MGPDCGGVSAVTMTGPTTWADVEPVEAASLPYSAAALSALSTSDTSSTLSMASAVNALVDEIIENTENEAVSDIYDMYEEALTGKEIENGEIVEDKDKASSGTNENAKGETQSGVNAAAGIENTIEQALAAPELQSAAVSPNVVSSAGQTNFEAAVDEDGEAVDPAASV